MDELMGSVCSLAVPTATGLERPSLCLLLMLGVLLQVRCQYPSDSCDYNIWDTGMWEDTGVQNLYLQCSAGRVVWRYPSGGGVRIILQLGSRKSRFQACFWAQARNVTAVLSLDQPEGLRQLVILDPPGTPAVDREICLMSTDGGEPISLFLETQRSAQSTLIGEVQLHYDMERSRPPHHDHLEDCRPCTNTELLHAVCSSDFVISATIEDVVHYEEHQETELLLHVHGILRQSLPLFTVTSPRRLRRSSPGIRWTADVGGPPLDQLPSPPTDPGGLEPKRYGGRVIAHHKCGIRRPQEPDELFLFLGRVKLRRARLQCAPRLDDFHAVWETALKNGENPCLLD